MSGLAALLAGRVAPGIFRWPSASDVADVRHTVEHAEWRFAHVEGWTAQTKAELLDSLGIALDFPEYYGHNFDALADCLHDVDAADLRGTVLLWDGWGPLAYDDPRAFSIALTVLGARVHAERGDPFAVLLRGDGPDPVGVATLD